MDFNKLSPAELDTALKVAEMFDRAKAKVSDEQLTMALKVAAESRKQGINPDFVLPIMMAESKFDPNAKSPKGAVGVAQLMEDTAKLFKVDRNDVDDNIRGGVAVIKDLMQDKRIGADPIRILVGYNTSSDTRGKYFESNDIKDLPDETQQYILNYATYHGNDKLPSPVLDTKADAESKEPEPDLSLKTDTQYDTSEEAPPREIPRAVAGLVGAGAGANVGAGAAAFAAKNMVKFDVLEKLAQNYPEILDDLKKGKSPMDVAKDLLAAKTSTGQNLPPAQGPLTGDPAGGRMTQNWVASQDAEGRYTDVGLKARDQAEAHQMKRAAMAAEDKIRQIAPEMRADPNRANLLIPQSAGRGPSPRLGGTPTVPVPPVAPPAAPSRWAGALDTAKHYGSLAKWPLAGAWTGFNVGQGAADVYNRVQANQPWEAGLSAAGTTAGTVAPFVSGVAAAPLAAAGAMVPAYLYTRDHPSARPSAILNEIREKGGKPNLLDLLAMPAYIGAKAARGE